MIATTTLRAMDLNLPMTKLKIVTRYIKFQRPIWEHVPIRDFTKSIALAQTHL